MQAELILVSHLSPNPSMQSLRALLIHNKNHLLHFPKSHSFPPLRSISSSPFFNRGWEEETRALFHPDRNPNPIPESPFDLFPTLPEIPSELERPQVQEEPEPKGVRKKVERISVPAIGKRKAGKVKVSWVCESCGAVTGQWWGTCPSCRLVGTLKQFSEGEVSRARGVEVSEASVRSWLPQKAGNLVPQRLKEVNKGREQSEWRIPL